MKCGEMAFSTSGKSASVSYGEIISTGRGVKTSITEKWFIILRDDGRQYEKRDAVLGEVSREGRCPQRPPAAARECI